MAASERYDLNQIEIMLIQIGIKIIETEADLSLVLFTHCFCSSKRIISRVQITITNGSIDLIDV
jgi:hypothetical protein